MIVAKVEAFDIDAFLPAGKGGADRSKALADFAREEFGKAQEINRQAIGSVPDHQTFVDGVRDAPLERVKPDGTIVFEFELASDVIAYCFSQVVKHSPVIDRDYQRSHRIFADGVEVETPELAVGAEEVVITTISPYARKIEGTGKRPPQSAQAPNGVYEVVATMARRRYSNTAQVRFTYRQPTGGATALEGWASKNAGRRQGAKAQSRQQARNTRQPAIVIRFR